MYRVLSCVIYYVIDNCIYIDYICCHPKKLSVIYSDKLSEESSYNGLLGISVPEVLMNHGFTKKKNSTVILVCQSRMGNYHLEMGFCYS